MVVYTLEQRWEILPHYFENHGKKIIFSDEAYFKLSGYVNKQNCHIWDTENPQAPKTSHCLVPISRGIIRPIFFENEQAEAVTVNGDRYRAMLNECCSHRGEYWQHLVSTGRRYVTHSRSYTRCFAPCF